MDIQTSLMILQFTCCLGFTLWLSLALINNLQAFASSVGVIGAAMSMAPLAQLPAIDILLLAQAIRSSLMHRLALSITVVLQVTAVVTAWAGCYELLFGASLEMARPRLNLVLSAVLGFLSGMLLDGLWFGYWVRQEGLQSTYLLLVVWVLANFFMLNVHWGQRELPIRESRARGR